MTGFAGLGQTRVGYEIGGDLADHRGTAGPRLTVGSSKFLALGCGQASALRPAVGVEEVGEGYGFLGFLAVGAEAAEPDAGARLVAVRAPLRAVVAGLARWAGEDGGVAA